VVKLQHYLEMEDIMHMAIKVEKQLKRKGSARLSGYLGYEGLKLNFRKERNAQQSQ